MKVEIFIRTPGENELIDTIDIVELPDFLVMRIGQLLEEGPNRELIIRQVKVPAEASISTWGGEF